MVSEHVKLNLLFNIVALEFIACDFFFVIRFVFICSFCVLVCLCCVPFLLNLRIQRKATFDVVGRIGREAEGYFSLELVSEKRKKTCDWFRPQSTHSSMCENTIWPTNRFLFVSCKTLNVRIFIVNADVCIVWPKNRKSY